MKKQLLMRIGGIVAAVGIAASLAVGLSSAAAAAAACGIGGKGPLVKTSASYYQQVSWDYCDSSKTIRVGVFVQPYGGYNPSHVQGCWAHLELTNRTIGAQTRSDRGVSCTTTARGTTAVWSVGPATWSGQNFNDMFFARAFVNIETTGGAYYSTEANASMIVF